jgi:hypothetical protein
MRLAMIAHAGLKSKNFFKKGGKLWICEKLYTNKRGLDDFCQGLVKS